MSKVIKLSAFLLLIISCHSKKALDSSPGKGEELHFTVEEVIATSHLLTSIIDSPASTSAQQKRYKLTPETAQKLMLPLHPLWDEKIREVSKLLPQLPKAKVEELARTCEQNCSCDFYQTVFEKHPAVLDRPLQKLFKQQSFTSCLEQLPALEKILDHLREEQADYEPEALF